MSMIICCCRSVYKCKLIPLFFCMTVYEQKGEKWNKYCLWVLRAQDLNAESFTTIKKAEIVWSQVQIGKLALDVALIYDTSVTTLKTHWLCTYFTQFKQWWGGCIAKGAQQKGVCLSSAGLGYECHFYQSLQANKCQRNVKINTDFLRNFICLKTY